MGTNEIRSHIEEICQKYNVDSSTFVVGYGKTITGNRIRFDISNYKKFNRRPDQYAVKYIENFKWYVIWKLGINKNIYTLSQRNAEAERNRYSSTVQKNKDYSGWGIETVLVFDETQFEEFICDLSKK